MWTNLLETNRLTAGKWCSGFTPLKVVAEKEDEEEVAAC